jgi:hypothetical protein
LPEAELREALVGRRGMDISENTDRNELIQKAKSL